MVRAPAPRKRRSHVPAPAPKKAAEKKAAEKKPETKK